MKGKHFLTAGALALSLISPIAMADDATIALSEGQKKEFEKLIHDYLVKNPDVLIEVSQALQQKQQITMQEQAKAAIKEQGEKLFQENLSLAGNPKGNVTVIEFFDYKCGHCKSMSKVMHNLLEKDSDVRVVYKEFPIFGEHSELAAKAALAAAMQGKYKPMHDALFKAEKSIDEKQIMELAQSMGIDSAKLKKDMASEEISKALKANRDLAEKLKLMGTPAFIVAYTQNGQFKAGTEVSFVPGAMTLEALQELIKKAASKTNG